MRKFVLLGVLAVIVIAGIIFGPSVMGLYRLQQYVTTTTNADREAAGSWPRDIDACTTCHGMRGASVNQNYPSLAGQPDIYLINQLHNFATGDRKNPTMGPLAMTMDDAEIKRLAKYFAEQPAQENRYFQPNGDLRRRGESLVQSGACAACHGDTLMGNEQFPRLAGQGYDYVLRQFEAFATGTRSESTGTMKTLSAAASPADRMAMATYIASLKPTSKTAQ